MKKEASSAKLIGIMKYTWSGLLEPFILNLHLRTLLLSSTLYQPQRHEHWISGIGDRTSGTKKLTKIIE